MERVVFGLALVLASALGAVLWIGEEDEANSTSDADTSNDPTDQSSISDDASEIVSLENFLELVEIDGDDEALIADEPVEGDTADPIAVPFGDQPEVPSEDETDTASDLEQTWYGGGSDDTIQGSIGDDFLAGGTGHDLILGGMGSDVLVGTDDYAMTEGDFPFYQHEDDTLIGGDGDDTIFAHGGEAEGGIGNDTFVSTGLSVLTISDFDEGDSLVIMQNPSEFDLAGGQSTEPEIEVRLSDDETSSEVFVDGNCAVVLEGVTSFSVDAITVVLADELQSEIWGDT